MRPCAPNMMAATALLVAACWGIAPASGGGEAPLPGMTSEFSSLVQTLRGKSPLERKAFASATSGERAAPAVRLRGENRDEVEAYIWLESWEPAIRVALEKAGADIVLEDAERFLVQAWVPIDRAEAIASVEGVRHLRRPSYAWASTGKIITEGEANMGTSFVRTFGGVDGTGLKVGVLSQGLYNRFFPSQTPIQRGANSDQRVRDGELPRYPDLAGPVSGYLGNVKLIPASHDLHDVQVVDENDDSGYPEGAAMLEIVHDLAPGADLVYAGANTDIEARNYREALVDEGCDVILDDLVYYDSGRFDGTSAIARQAQRIAIEKDIVYVVATGNQTPPPTNPNSVFDEGLISKRFPLFVASTFTSLPGTRDTNYHNWSAGRNPASPVIGLGIRPVDGIVDVILVWDDVWDDQNPRATDDIDMFLFSSEGVQDGQLIGSSVDVQYNSNNPIERITEPVSGQGDLFYLAIGRKDTKNTSPVIFTLVILQGIVEANSTQYLTHGVAGNNGDAMPPVISVGAIDQTQGIGIIDDTTVPGIDPGPGRFVDKSFLKWTQTQKVPAVVGYSRASTLSMRYMNEGNMIEVGQLVGSSSGAAHIAGLVTLLRHDFREIPAFEFYDILRGDDPNRNSTEFPTATRLFEERLAPYGNAPVYLRTNGFDTWSNISGEVLGGKRRRSVMLSTVSETAPWESSGPIAPFNAARFDQTANGLEISPAGRQNVFGYWQTPVLSFRDYEGNETTMLDPDRLYELTVTVGTDEADPTRVPDFRLRLTSGGNDESAMIVIAGLDGAASNAPDSLGGREYKLYYRPSNAAIAAQGVRFAFDLVHFSAADNADATLILRDFRLRELSLP